MLWLIIAAIFAIVFSILVEDGKAMWLLFPLALGACTIAGTTGKIDITEISYHKIIPINGYYINNGGEFVTEDDIRSSVTVPAIPQDSISKPIYIMKKYTKVNPNFFHFKQETTVFTVTFNKEEGDK